jgi:hypothetical protein
MSEIVYYKGFYYREGGIDVVNTISPIRVPPIEHARPDSSSKSYRIKRATMYRFRQTNLNSDYLRNGSLLSFYFSKAGNPVPAKVLSLPSIAVSSSV